MMKIMTLTSVNSESKPAKTFSKVIFHSNNKKYITASFNKIPSTSH